MNAKLKYMLVFTASIGITAWPLLGYFYGVDNGELSIEEGRINDEILKEMGKDGQVKKGAVKRQAVQGALRRYLNAQLDKAERSDIHDIKSFIKIANIFYLTENHDRALEVLSLGLTSNPRSVLILMMIGGLEAEAEREHEALAVYKQLLKIEPSNSRAYNDAANLYYRGGSKLKKNVDMAFNYASHAVMLQPNNPYYLDTLASICHGMGRFTQASELMQQALALAPNDKYLQMQRILLSSNGQ